MNSPVDRSAIVASWARIVFDAPHVGPRDVFYTRAVPDMEAGWYVRASVLANRARGSTCRANMSCADV